MASSHAVAGVTGIPQKMGTIHSRIDTLVNFEIPAKVTSEHMRKVEKDLELLRNLVRHHTPDMCDLHNAVVEGRLANAVAIGRKLGLQEHRFVAAGGGAAWIPIVAGVMVVVMVTEAVAGAFGGGESAEPHTEPEEPGGDEGEDQGAETSE